MVATLTYSPTANDSEKLFLPVEQMQTLPNGLTIDGRMMLVLPGTHQIPSEQGEAILAAAETYPAIAALLDSNTLFVSIDTNDESVDFSSLSDSEQGQKINQQNDLTVLETWAKSAGLKAWRASQLARKIKKLRGM